MDITLPESRISIVGLGLMGGSLAMALHGKCRALFGVDPDPGTLELGEKLNIFSKIALEPDGTLSESNVVILAAPAGTILQLLRQLPDLHPGNAIVMDIGSTKNEIMAAYQELPTRFVPIGGHPMCGKETSTIVNADPSIFQNAPFAFTRIDRTTQEACEFAVQMAESIGAKPFWIDAETHDAWTAAISHLPYLLSLSLALSTPPDAKPLIGPGFKSVSRLAGKPSSMMIDIIKTNRDQILQACSQFSEQFQEISRLIEDNDYETIAAMIEAGRMKRDLLVTEE
jgi:prephenate dehydrogenase